MDIKSYFDQLAAKWDDMVYHDDEKINRILDYANLKTGDVVLDVGTGTGVMIRFILERIKDTGKIVAVDISENMIQIARGKYAQKNINFICDDVFNLEYDSFFDVIVCYSVFPHFEEKEKIIKKFYTMLKMGGKLIICHSQSREIINNMHLSLPWPINNHYLPEASILSDMLKKERFEINHSIDSHEMYVVVATKVW